MKPYMTGDVELPVCWTELNEHKVIGPNIMKDTEDKVRVIQQRLKAASDRHKSYVDFKRKDIVYEVGDSILESITVEEDTHIWKEREVESKIH